MTITNKTERCPWSSPWGDVEERHKLAEGIWSVSTANHGGIYVSNDRWPEMPHALRYFNISASQGWFEEDCDAALVVLAFPDLFDIRRRFEAVETVSKYFANYFATAWREFSKTPQGKRLVAEHAAFFRANSTNFKMSISSYDPSRGWSISAARLDDKFVAAWEQPDYPYDLCSKQPFSLKEIEKNGVKVTITQRDSDTCTTNSKALAESN